MGANNYAATFIKLQEYEEARSLLRKTIPVARRVLGENDRLALKMRWAYACAPSLDDGATVDDLRESVKTLEETVPTARRVFGGGHQLTVKIEISLRKAQAALRAREESDVCNAMAAMAPGDA